jgi:hypothetical protein
MGSQWANKCNREAVIQSVQNAIVRMDLHPYCRGVCQRRQAVSGNASGSGMRDGRIGKRPFASPPVATRRGGPPSNFSHVFLKNMDSDNLFCSKCQSEAEQMLSHCMGVRTKTRLESPDLGLAHAIFPSIFIKKKE